MIDWFAILAIGFFLGMRHATDADHVVAVTTIVSRHRSIRGAAAVGLWWGLGHTLTILVVGSGIVLFGWVIPPRVGLSMEFSVGIMLIILGAITLIGVRRRIPDPTAAHGTHNLPAHAHAHGDYIHTHPTHPHSHEPQAHPHDPRDTVLGRIDRRFGRIRLYLAARPLIVGMVHGLAGSAAVALLVLAAIDDPRWSIFYMLLFGAGTIIGMMLITVAVAAPFAFGRARSNRFGFGLRLAAGLLSVGFGILIAWQVGIVDGLFSDTPAWSPK